jgi:hypothetical protein
VCLLRARSWGGEVNEKNVSYYHLT